MPRPNRPGYFADRKVWRFMLHGKRVYICKGIPPGEKPQRDGIPRRVWDEMDRRIRAAEEASVAGPAELTLYWLVQGYLSWVEAEVAAGRTAPSRYVNQRLHLNILLEHSGLRDVLAGSIPVDAVEDFFARLRAVVSERTGQSFQPYYIHCIGKTLRGMLRWAARPVPGRNPVRLIRADPLAGYAYPKQPGAVRGYVEGATVRRFLRWAWAASRWAGVARPVDPATGKPALKPAGVSAGNLKRRFDRIHVLMLRFERLTGCRPGEACGLAWAEISPPPPPRVPGADPARWEPRTITVAPDRVKTRKQTDRARKIHITPPVARLLRAIERLPRRHPEFVFTHMRGTRSAGRGHLDPVAGEPWESGSAASKKVTAWRRQAIAAGVEGIEDAGPRKLVPYSNRHALASEGSSLGFTDEQIAEQLGNTPEVLRRVYAHSVDDVAADTARQLGERRREINRKRRERGPAAG